MKKFVQLIFFAGLLAFTVAYPGLLRRETSDESLSRSEESKEVEKDGILLVLPNQKNIFNDDNVNEGLDRPKFYPGFWESPMRENPFDNIFAKMQEAMRRWAALTFESALKDQLSNNGTGGLSQFGSSFGSPFGKIPEGANTTSTTKVVGNHTVVVNETVHRENNEFGSSIFHVKIVEVKPNHPVENDDDDIEKEVAEEKPDKKPELLDENVKPNEKEAEKVPEKTENKDDVKNDEVNEISKNQVELIRA